MRIAIVDDDRTQLLVVDSIAKSMGYACDMFVKGREFLHEAQAGRHDLYIVDWELPDIEGPQIVRQLRTQLMQPIPILLLTHRNEERDIALGLMAGADDYIVKTSRLLELKSRLMALLRRGGHVLASMDITLGNYRLSPIVRKAWIKDVEVELKGKEFDLALFLFRHPELLVSRESLIENVLDGDSLASSRTLDVYISRLRNKLQLRGEHGQELHTIYGLGYRLHAQDMTETGERGGT